MQPLQHSFTAADSIVRVADLFIRRNAKMRQYDCMHYAAADSSVLIRTYPYKAAHTEARTPQGVSRALQVRTPLGV